MPLASKYVTSADSVKIYAEADGNPSKQAIVFTPGFACATFHFKRQFSDPDLLDKFFLVVYEPRGYGRSDQPVESEAYESIYHAQDFKAVCDAFNVTKPVTCGWSLGSILPADLIAAYGPSYITGSIILGGFPYRSMHPEVAHPYIMELVPHLLNTDLAVFHKSVKDFAYSCISPRSRDQLPFEDLCMWMGNVVQMVPIVRTHTFLRLQDPAPLIAVARTLPYLVIQGADDLHVISANLKAFMETNFANVEFHELAGVGHAPFYEAPEITNKLISDFVQKITMSPATQ